MKKMQVAGDKGIGVPHLVAGQVKVNLKQYVDADVIFAKALELFGQNIPAFAQEYVANVMGKRWTWLVEAQLKMHLKMQVI